MTREVPMAKVPKGLGFGLAFAASAIHARRWFWEFGFGLLGGHFVCNLDCKRGGPGGELTDGMNGRRQKTRTLSGTAIDDSSAT